MIKIDVPTFNHKLISTGESLTCRPFTVKEEKLFLMAAESKEPEDLVNTTLQVIQNCVLNETFDAESLPYFDVDYLLISLRSQSIGGSVEMDFICKNQVDGETCGNRFNGTIGLSDVVIHKDDMKDPKIGFGEVGIEMKYPTYKSMKKNLVELNDIKQQINLMSESIKAIWDKDTVYNAHEMTKLEMEEFIEGLTKENFNKLLDFVDGAPWLRLEKTLKCKKCGNEELVEYEGFESFFE